MKNPFQILMAALFLLILLVAAAQAGAPAAILPESQYYFGAAIEGEIVRHDFILLNKGNADLKIENIKTG